PANRDHVRGGRGVDHAAAVGGVTSGCGVDNARDTEVLGVVGEVGGRLASAPAVGDVLGAQRGGGRLLGYVQPGTGVVVGLHQVDLAQRADRRDHVDVERFLQRPVVIGGGRGGQRRGLAFLVVLGELPGRQGRQARGGPVCREVAGCCRVVGGIDHCDRRPRPRGGGRCGEAIGGLEV